MSRPRSQLKPRRPVFLGCEGKSEEGYGGRLKAVARDSPIAHVHIRVEILQPGAGDPLQLVCRAVQKIAAIERRRERFAVKALLLDCGAPDKMEQASRLAQTSGIDRLIWQDPDHEAFLLRHLPGCRDLRPPAGQSLQELKRRWPSYEKGLSALELAERIDMQAIAQACSVEPALDAFLRSLGLV